MQLFFYKLQLALHLGLFLLKLSANFSNKTKPILLTLFIVGLVCVIIGVSVVLTRQEPTEKVIAATATPNNIFLYEYQKLTQEQLEEQLVFWEKIAEKQPSSRDVLLNISQLYSALQLEENAAFYKEKALTIDPNNQLFK